MLEVMGWIGATLFSLCAVPQVIRTYITKSAKDFSWGFLGMWFWGEILTFIYVLSINIQVDEYQYPLLVNYVFNFILLLYLIYAKYFYKGEKSVQT